MGNLQGTKINKIDGGNGRLTDTNERVFLMVAPCASGSSLVNGKAVRLIQVKDIEDLRITESYDANNKLLVHHHVSEFFRMAPEGTLYFLPLAKNATIANAVTATLPVLKANPEIKGVGLFGFAEATLATAITTANTLQSTLVNEVKKSGVLLDCVLMESGTGGATALNAYPDLSTATAENVSVIIGQDPAIANLETEYKNYSAIGTALGSLAVRKISENLGSTSIENKPNDKKSSVFYSLTDAATGMFTDASLATNGQKVSELSNEQLKDLVDKGYILIASYVGASGMYFSGSSTCTSKTSKYSTIENNAVWNGAARLIREALAPYIKGKVKKDPATGYIRSTTIAHWERVATKACIERLEAENEISGGEIYISPKQKPNADNPVKISVTVVSDEIVHSFEVDLSLS